MKKYYIEVREVLSKIIPVEAESEKQAWKIGNELYKKAENEWILSADDCIEGVVWVIRE